MVTPMMVPSLSLLMPLLLLLLAAEAVAVAVVSGLGLGDWSPRPSVIVLVIVDDERVMVCTTTSAEVGDASSRGETMVAAASRAACVLDGCCSTKVPRIASSDIREDCKP